MKLFFPENQMQTALLKEWVNHRLKEPVMQEEVFTVAVIDDESYEILAGAIFSSYTGENVFLSGAIDKEGIGKVTRGHLADMLKVAYQEPFNCLRITALVQPDNERSKRFVTGLGFKHEGTLRDYLAEDTETLIYGLTRREFLGGRYGRRQRRRQPAAA